MRFNEHPEQPPTLQAPLDSLVRRPIGRIACVVAWISFSCFGLHSKEEQPYAFLSNRVRGGHPYVVCIGPQREPVKVFLVSGDICTMQQFFFHLGGNVVILWRHELLEISLRSLNFQWYLPDYDTHVFYWDIFFCLLTWLINLISSRLWSNIMFCRVTRGSKITLIYIMAQSKRMNIVPRPGWWICTVTPVG